MSGIQGRFTTAGVQAVAAIGAALALIVTLVVATTSGAATGSAPPYEPLPNPPAVGTLKFFNAAGQEITGGSVTDAPFAAFVQSSTAGRAGDTKATLFGYLPKNGVPYDAWTGQALTASPNYPNASAPGALATSTLPVVTVGQFDYKLSELAENFPNTATDAYQGLYQLRVKTSGPGLGTDTKYSVADIKITGTTWTVVYPEVPVTTTTAPTTTTTTTAPTTTTTSTTTTTAPPTTTTTTTTPPTTTTTTSTTTTTKPTTTTTAPPTTTTTTTTPPTTTTTTIPTTPGNDSFTVKVRGAIDYANSGGGTGDIAVKTDQWGIHSVTGSLKVPSTVSGTATVSVDVHRLWIFPVWVGRVEVSDPGAKVAVSTPVFGWVFKGTTAASATSTNSWYVLGTWPQLFAPYSLSWSFTDAG